MGSGQTRRGDRQLDLEGGEDAQAAQRRPAWACVCGQENRCVVRRVTVSMGSVRNDFGKEVGPRLKRAEETEIQP